MDCALDAMENAHFASVGGLDRRVSMQAPSYVIPSDRESYLDGYRAEAEERWGPDWQSCTFEWKHALTIHTDDRPEPL